MHHDHQTRRIVLLSGTPCRSGLELAFGVVAALDAEDFYLVRIAIFAVPSRALAAVCGGGNGSSVRPERTKEADMVRARGYVSFVSRDRHGL